MKNGLYMCDADMSYFNNWFKDVYNAKYPDNKLDGLGIKTVTIVVTEACNLACKYCYQHHKTTKCLTKEKAHQIVDFLLDNGKLNGYVDSKKFPCVIFDFIGGEPTLKIDVMDYFMEYFKYKSIQMNHPWAINYMISIASNGILYRTKKVQDFLKKNEGKVSIGITIDGTKELHDSCRVYPDGRGSYDDVEKSVKLWVKQQKQPTTKVTLAPENLEYLVESIVHLWKLGIICVPANVVFENVWNDAKYPKLYYKLLKELADKIIEKKWYKTNYTTLFSEMIGEPLPASENTNWCGGDGKMLAVGVDGTCYPCLRYMSYCFSTPGREPLVIGDIYKGIKCADECPKLKEIQSITRRSQSTDKCFNCPIAKGCSWCSAFNYDMFGTANKRTTYHCDMHKARVLANVYYWNKLYQKLGILKTFELHVPKEWALKIINENEFNMLEKLSGGMCV